MAKILIVGDPHVTPLEIPDVTALMDLVVDTAESEKVDAVLILGDLYNTHDIVNTRCIDFWKKHLSRIKGADLILLVGNHDQVTPTIRDPHALLSHEGYGYTIVDKPTVFEVKGVKFAALPYYYEPDEFIKEANGIFDESLALLFCHQTFSGADKGMGFYDENAVDVNSIKFKTIISGHIHTPMKVGKVWYPGAPRWRTVADADVKNRGIYIWENNKVKAIKTDTICTRIYKLEDRQEEPLEITLTPEQLLKADLRISIYGTQEYVSVRRTELTAKYNARCRTFPIVNKKIKISESEGILPAFKRFATSFNPPKETPIDILLKEADKRLSV